MKIHVVGGCYPEICLWPNINEIHGSGGRAAEVISQLAQKNITSLHSVLEPQLKPRLIENFSLLECELNIADANITPIFEYDHPLARPKIFPDRYELSKKTKLKITLNVDNAVIFGMLEATSHVTAKRIVYDPQNSDSPQLFSETDNQAEELTLILNQAEAKIFHKKINTSPTNKNITIENIADDLQLYESAKVIVIKCGQRGAFVKESSQNGKWISAYKTNKVFPIGSGDCFVATFAYYWIIESLNAYHSAQRASAVTAFYCENRTYPDASNVDKLLTEYISLKCEDHSLKKVYLAGPFFNLKEMWLINQAKQALTNSGVKVFSPYHDVGPGSAEEVVQHDIIAIEESDALYALFDGEDPGTLFEIGYAIKCGKPVVIFAETAGEESLKMFEGTGCIICRDFSTSIYKLSWSLNA